MGRNIGRGNVAYNWISPDPAKAELTLGGVVVIVVAVYTTLIFGRMYGNIDRHPSPSLLVHVYNCTWNSQSARSHEM